VVKPYPKSKRIKLTGKALTDLKFEVWERDSIDGYPVCQYCFGESGSPIDKFPHHIIFKGAGGDDSKDNLITLCIFCHALIHARKLFINPETKEFYMKIYRIQDKEGRGPWKAGFSHQWVETREDHDNLLPAYIDFESPHLKVKKGNYSGVGCRSKEQLKRWFTESEYKKLVSFGYESVIIKVDNIIAESDIQLVFERSKPLNKNTKYFELY